MSEFLIDSDPEYHNFSAVNTESVPSVTMNGGSLILATRNPLKAPISVPIAIPPAIAIGSGTPEDTASLPITNVERTNIAPTERSIPAVRIINVCAIATRPITVTCWSTNDKTPGLKNLGAMMPNIKILTIRTNAGTSVGKLLTAFRTFDKNVWSSRSNTAIALSVLFKFVSDSDWLTVFKLPSIYFIY